MRTSGPTYTSVIDAMTGVAAYCEVILSENARHIDEDLAEDVYIDKQFRDTYAQLLSRHEADKYRLSRVGAELNAFNDKNVLARWLNRASEEALHQRRHQAQCDIDTTSAQVLRARHEYMNDLAIRTGARAVLAQLAERKRVRGSASEIVREVNRLKTKIRSSERQHGDLSELLVVTAPNDSIAANRWTLEYAAAFLGNWEANFARELKQVLRVRAAKEQAEQILDKLDECSPMALAQQPPAFASNTLATMQSLLAGAPHIAHSFEQLLTLALDPRAFGRQEAWLMFWTALSATAWYAPMSEDMGVSEDPKADWWCENWRRQMSDWTAETLAATGIDRQSLQCAVCHLQNSGAERRSGGDVLLILLVSLPNRQYCSVANIQFKRAARDDHGIPLNQSDWRQYETLAKVQDTSRGRIFGMHALARNMLDGIATVPALSIHQSRALVEEMRSLSAYQLGRQGLSGRTIDWGEHGEALSTMLTQCLTQEQACFETVDELFDWFESNLDIELPSYMVIQGVGERAQSIKHALDRGYRLATSRGREYRTPGRAQPMRPRGPKHDRGPSGPSLG